MKKMPPRRHSRKVSAGFTLIEILIVTAVFSMVVLIATTVFANIQTSQRGVLTRQRVVADGRYLLETMARSVRIGRIDYAYYRLSGSLPDAQTILATRDQSNDETCYRLDTEAIQVLTGATNCAGGTWETITPPDLRVTDFHVFVSPASDPYMSVPIQPSDCKTAPTGPADCATVPGRVGYCADLGVCLCINSNDCWSGQACNVTGTFKTCQNATSQPQATIVFWTKSKNVQAGESAEALLQTTVTSKFYQH